MPTAQQPSQLVSGTVAPFSWRAMIPSLIPTVCPLQFLDGLIDWREERPPMQRNEMECMYFVCMYV